MITNGPQGGEGASNSSSPQHGDDWWSELGHPSSLPPTAREALINLICAKSPAFKPLAETDVGSEQGRNLSASDLTLLPKLSEFRHGAQNYVRKSVLDAEHRKVIYPDPILSGVSQINGYSEFTVLFDLRVPQTGRSLAVALSPHRFGPSGVVRQDFPLESCEVNPGSVLLGISSDPSIGVVVERVFVTPTEFEHQTELALSGDINGARRSFFAACARSAIASQYGEFYDSESLSLSLCGRDRNTTHFFAQIKGRPTDELTFTSLSISDACELSAKVQRRAA